MFLIHPTSELAYSLRVRTIHFFQELGLQQTPELMDTIVIIRALMDDAMSSRFIWCKANESVRTVTNNTFQWSEETHLRNVSTGEVNDLFDHYYSEVLDDFDMSIQTWLDHHMPRRTWDIWHLTALGRDLVLDKGPDYRILDWERRMKSGEWR